MDKTLHSAQDSYEVLQSMGQGGMGVTYLVRSQKSGEKLVAKQMRLDKAASWKNVELFEREAAVMKRLDHPNLPRYIDYFTRQEDRSTFLVQTFIPGRTLQEYIKDQTPLETDQLEMLLRQALQVLIYLHSLNPPVIHRDIKPENIIISGQAQQSNLKLYLIDFGAVKNALKPDEVSLTAIGTFGFMAPEQGSGHAVPGSDLYSLGMTFLALATHRDPAQFVDEATGQIDSDYGAAIPDKLRSILEAMTRIKLEERLGDAEQAFGILAGTVSISVLKTVRKVRKPAVPSSRFQIIKQHYLIFSVFLLFLFLSSAWLTTLRKPEGLSQTLGGWFTGHSRLISAVTGTLFANNRLLIRPNRVKLVAYAPDGQTLASVGGRDDVLIWKADSIRPDTCLNQDRILKHIKDITFTADSKFLALGHEDRVHLYDIKAKGYRYYVQAPGGTFQTLQPLTGATILAAFTEDSTIIVKDIARQQDITRVRFDVEEIYRVALSPPGRKIAAVGGKPLSSSTLESQLTIWNISESKPLLTLKIADHVEQLTFSPDENYLLAAAYTSVMLVNLTSGKVEDTFQQANLAAFAPDSRTIALVENGEYVYDIPLIRVFNFHEDREIASFKGHDRSISSIHFSPQGTHLASASKDQTVKIWNIQE
ncbi:protein kinase [candidate division CSSED10-310 bacterium]|uniref:non-specific serine/threonine protein kinase n=1 Tax=candidate division CSSED10-310 bacterium TaxID=2855610 RepID=A0ABV6YZL2_UNCC1